MSKDEAIKQLQGMVVGAEWLSDSMVQALSVAIEALSADVVEVVRCKDCIHNDQCKHRVVMWVEDPINTWHKDIDFCSYGERKEQENEVGRL